MHRARLRTWLPLVVLALACADGDPTGLDGIEPGAYLAPNTGIDCGANCLPDDVESAWLRIGSPPAYSHFDYPATVDPTYAGGIMEVTYCRIRNSDSYQFGCYEPTSWWQTAAEWPSRKVKIGGREPSNITRVTFESYAPWPVVELMEYERPETAQCSYGGSTLYCNGTYRVQVALHDAGWYNTDRFYVSVQKADGSRIGITDNTGVVSGETVSWTWSAIPHAEPGSKLVITYFPWEGKEEGKVEHVLPLRDASPSLTLDAREAPQPTAPFGGPMRIQVDAGTRVEFEAAASGATLIEVLGWEWTPADTMQMPMTGTCAPGVNPCAAPVYETGTMMVSARVDGQPRTAVAPVGIEPELEVFAAPARITAGTLVTFEANASGGALTNLTWRWNPDPTASLTSTCAQGQGLCQISVHESGWMVANADIGGVACADSAHVHVLCNFFQNLPADSALQDTMIQRELSRLWDITLPGDPQHGLEQGGYLIRRGPNLEFHPFARTGDLCGIDHDLADFQEFEGSDGDLVGIIHTHPFKADTVPNFGNCGSETRPRLIFSNGPSPSDFDHVAKARYYRPGNDVRGFVMDQDSVTIIRADWDYTNRRSMNPQGYREARNKSCQID